MPGGHEDRSTLSEGTTLLPKTATDGSHRSSSYGATHDLEGQQIETAAPPNAIAHAFDASRSNIRRIVRAVANPRGWAWKGSWRDVLLRPASYVPAVILGLLLNVLDALSYGNPKPRPIVRIDGLMLSGMILFPLGQPIFAGLGPDGISMFYVSCIVSQLVYSCGGSIFKGGIGSEMVSERSLPHEECSSNARRSKLSLSSTRWLSPSWPASEKTTPSRFLRRRSCRTLSVPSSPARCSS